MVKESSDEKLLKLIEGRAEGRRLPNVGIKFKGALPGQKLKFPVNLKINLNNLNMVVFFICIVSTLVFVYRVFTQESADSARLFLSVIPETGSAVKTDVKNDSGFPPLQEYLDALDRRNMFLPFGAGQNAGETDKRMISSLFADAAQELKVVGIVWSENPEAMIEDKADSRTYLLKKGDTVGARQYRIKEVRRASVLLEVETGSTVKEFEIR